MALAVLLGLTGAGGMAYAVGPGWTEYLYFAPLGQYLAFAAYLTLRRLLGLGGRQTFLGLAVFAAGVFLTRALPEPYRLGGAAAYAPCLAFLLLAAGAVRHRQKHAAAGYLRAAALLAAGLGVRAAVATLCPYWPVPPLWHLLHAAALYVLAGVVCERRAPGSRERVRA